MSAIASAGIDTSITGNINAVCTSATIDTTLVSCVISQAAPTACTSKPR